MPLHFLHYSAKLVHLKKVKKEIDKFISKCCQLFENPEQRFDCVLVALQFYER